MLLGHTIKGSGFGEVEQALDILTSQPATARHLSQDLAVYFVGDHPPAALVDRMAATFKRTDGDVAAVLSTLFSSREFDASLGTQFKDPIHYLVSAVRLSYGDRVITNPLPLQRWAGRHGGGAVQPPDPRRLSADLGRLERAGTDDRAVRDRAPDRLRRAKLFVPADGGPGARPPAQPPKAALHLASLDRPLGAPTQAALAQADSPGDWSTLFLASPEFMHR